MQHFYDGQIRRYITQVIRLMSNFSYEDSDGKLTEVPVMYGDMTRQVANIIRDNSENKIPSAPRISVYVTGLEMDRTRTSDASFVDKMFIRERAYDENNEEYLNTQGKNYTVERLMPTPYILKVRADIWSTNTEQKLQIMEQILMLFNPSLEIQTTDNYIDWTSLTVVNLDDITFSSRSIPVGVDSEIDVANLDFSTPIYISPPVKVKKLGVVTNVVMSIFDESRGNIDLGKAFPQLNTYGSAIPGTDGDWGMGTDSLNLQVSMGNGSSSVSTGYENYDLLVLNGEAQLVAQGRVGVDRWIDIMDAIPGTYQAGITQLQLKRNDLGSSVNATVAINSLDDTKLTLNYDQDTIPTNTPIVGPQITSGNVDKIVDPLTYNPTNDKVPGFRVLLLGPIGNTNNVDGPDAWKGVSNIDFIADVNDIIEWDGNEWQIIFDASAASDSSITYVTNLNTGIQYKYVNDQWILSFEGEYRNGTWRLVF